MSNLGLERFLQSQKLALHRTPVGDRYVVEAMRDKKCNVGGEQSGHIVLSDYSTTGDGLIASLQILACIRERGRKASEVCNLFKPLPQVLTNVKANADVLQKPAIKLVIEEAEKKLSGIGRLLIRKSGTEPLIRVMAEGDDEKLVRALVEEIVGAIKKEAA
jgi:phosphoglucosamine mutase